MNYKEYFKYQFQKDLHSLKLQKPSNVILDNAEAFGVDKNTLFFGGPDWHNIRTDLRKTKYKEYFILGLFIITVLDMAFYSKEPENYLLFRQKTNYPKFGWSGFGPHFENPKKLLDIAEKRGLISNNKILDELTELFITEIHNFFEVNIPEKSPTEFIHKIIEDYYFQGDNCKSVFGTFKQHLIIKSKYA